MNSFVAGLVISTIAYFVARFYIKRHLDEMGIPKSMTRSLVIFVLAAAIAYGVAFLIDWVVSASASAQSGITLVERQRLPIESAAASHQLRVTLVNIEGSGWTRERALGALRDTATIFAQCDVALQDAEWMVISAPERLLDYSTPVARQLVQLQPVRRPAIYLVRDTLNRPAFDAEAIGRGNSRSRLELADTVWITAATRDAGIVFAHELAHLLMDSGEHSDAPGNLMRDQTSAGSTALSAAQCARMRDTGSENGLLSVKAADGVRPPRR